MDLAALDPGSQDERYWTWFQESIMSKAMAELGRRQRMARATVSEVLTSWSRSLVPAALAAATIATIVAISGHNRVEDFPSGPVAFDELAQEGLDEAAQAVLLSDGDEGLDPSSFMALVEREDE